MKEANWICSSDGSSIEIKAARKGAWNTKRKYSRQFIQRLWILIVNSLWRLAQRNASWTFPSFWRSFTRHFPLKLVLKFSGNLLTTFFWCSIGLKVLFNTSKWKHSFRIPIGIFWAHLSSKKFPEGTRKNPAKKQLGSSEKKWKENKFYENYLQKFLAFLQIWKLLEIFAQEP